MSIKLVDWSIKWARFMAASIARENIRNIDEAASFADKALAEYEARFLNQ